jgi:hypothetical protein
MPLNHDIFTYIAAYFRAGHKCHTHESCCETSTRVCFDKSLHRVLDVFMQYHPSFFAELASFYVPMQFILYKLCAPCKIEQKLYPNHRNMWNVQSRTDEEFHLSLSLHLPSSRKMGIAFSQLECALTIFNKHCYCKMLELTNATKLRLQQWIYWMVCNPSSVHLSWFAACCSWSATQKAYQIRDC